MDQFAVKVERELPSDVKEDEDEKMVSRTADGDDDDGSRAFPSSATIEREKEKCQHYIGA